MTEYALEGEKYRMLRTHSRMRGMKTDRDAKFLLSLHKEITEVSIGNQKHSFLSNKCT